MNMEELANRLQAMEDLEAIKKMHRQYIAYLDNLEFEKALDLFIDDATVEVRNSGPMKGKDSFSKIYLGTLKNNMDRNESHIVGQSILNVDGDTASGHWIVFILFSVPQVEWVTGRNDCEYVKVNGQWKFKRLKFTRTNASKPELFP